MKSRLITGFRLRTRGKRDQAVESAEPKKHLGTQYLLTYAKSKLITIPIVLAALVSVPAASNWIPERNQVIPTISPAPTLVIAKPVLPTESAKVD